MDSQYNIFICHAKEDSQLALTVAAFLESRKLQCWLSTRDVKTGNDYAKSIIEAIQGSRLMLVILSTSANRSNNVRIEVERGFNNDLALLPFRISDVKPGQSLEFFLSAYQWLDATSGQPEDHFEALYARCADLLQTGIIEPPLVIKEDKPTIVEPPVVIQEDKPPVIEPVVIPIQKTPDPPVEKPSVQPPPPVNPPAQEQKLPPPPVLRPPVYNPPQPGSKKGLVLPAAIVGGLILLFFVYHAFFQKHAITFVNNAHTPVYIELDGQLTKIPAYGSCDYKARNNYHLQTTANTYVLNMKGHIIGQSMEWQIDTTINAWKNFQYPLNVGADYFLMRVTNNSPANVTYLKVSEGDHGYSYEFSDTYIPNDGTKYDLGYFRVLPHLVVYMSDANGKALYWTNGTNNLSFPDTVNQSHFFLYKY